MVTRILATTLTCACLLVAASAAAFAATAPVATAPVATAPLATAPVATARAATPAPILTDAAGTGAAGVPVPGPATSTPLGSLQGVAIDSAGTIYLADYSNNEILRLAPDGTLSVLAGTGAAGAAVAGPATASPLQSPSGIAVDAAGDVYVADSGDNEILRITPDGTLSVVAGTGAAEPVTPGPATASALNTPTSVAVDAAGDLYVADSGNCDVVQVTAAGALSVLAGTGTCGTPVPGPATSSPLADPRGVAVDDSGTVYVADPGANVVEKVSAGTLSVFAGRINRWGRPTAGSATASRLEYPIGVTVDPAGDVLITDAYAGRVVQVAAGTLSIVAGTGDGPPSYGRAATRSRLDWPAAVAVNPAGWLYIAESGGQTLDRVAPPPPAATTAPAIAGAARQGATLTASTGVWSGNPTAFALQWTRDGQPIAGATGATYVASADDVGHALSVTVTATSPTGAGTRASAPTATVLPPAPAVAAPPGISGTTTDLQTLHASPGAWSNAPTAYTYAWEDCDAAGAGCTAIAGAASSTYTLTPDDVGETLRVTVTAANAGGRAAAPSASTAVIAPASTPWANTAPPAPRSVPGVSISGQTLTCVPGTWAGNPTALGFQWSRDRQPIAGATGATYVAGAADAGKTLECTVTAGNAGGSITAVSAPLVLPGGSAGAAGAVPATVAGCPGAAETIGAGALGPLRIGETPGSVGRCLTPADGTIQVFYAPAPRLAAIAGARRSRLSGRVVVLLTSELAYSLHGVRSGASVVSLRRRLHDLGRPVSAGDSRWYFIPGRRSDAVVEARGGYVRRLGVAAAALCTGPAAQRRLAQTLRRGVTTA